MVYGAIYCLTIKFYFPRYFFNTIITYKNKDLIPENLLYFNLALLTLQ